MEVRNAENAKLEEKYISVEDLCHKGISTNNPVVFLKLLCKNLAVIMRARKEDTMNNGQKNHFVPPLGTRMIFMKRVNVKLLLSELRLELY